jgi:molecular chaperone DnaJ
VEVPTKLNARQRQLLEEFAAQSGHEVSPKTKGFIEQLRNFFD